MRSHQLRQAMVERGQACFAARSDSSRRLLHSRKTPWQLGDADWPVRADLVMDWVNQHGRQHLQQAWEGLKTHDSKKSTR